MVPRFVVSFDSRERISTMPLITTNKSIDRHCFNCKLFFACSDHRLVNVYHQMGLQRDEVPMSFTQLLYTPMVDMRNFYHIKLVKFQSVKAAARA